MLKDYLNESAKAPKLTYHTLNKCDEFIVFYGGLKDVSEFSGDLFILKKSKNKVVCANYSDNTTSKIFLIFKVFLNQDIPIPPVTIALAKIFTFSEV